jgi:dCTP deaminase
MNLQPASYDLTLARDFLIPNGDVVLVDMADVKSDHMIPETVDNGGIVIEPGEFILGSTREKITVGKRFVARIEGKSSIGRLGLLVHVTAGFVDPGFSGQITLEMYNASPWQLVIYPGQRIAQISFSRLEHYPTHLYGDVGNHYMDQSGPVASRFSLE